MYEKLKPFFIALAVASTLLFLGYLCAWERPLDIRGDIFDSF